MYIFANKNSILAKSLTVQCMYICLKSKIVFYRFSEKSPGKLLPLSCTLLSLSIIMQMFLFQNYLIIVVFVCLNCLVVIIQSWYYSGTVI